MKIARTALAVVALSCLLFSGCSALMPGKDGFGYETNVPNGYSTWRYKKTERNQSTMASMFDSWFGQDEPEPPKSMMEWMDLEPIRP